MNNLTKMLGYCKLHEWQRLLPFVIIMLEV